MKKQIISVAAALCLTSSVFAQGVNIYPKPDSITAPQGEIELSVAYKLTNAEYADKDAMDILRRLLKTQAKEKGINIIVGERNDKALKKFVKNIPAVSGGYYLTINDKQIVIAGHDERGTYYGVRTFAQLIKNSKVPKLTIIDQPDLPFRGIVEGFYGTPWSHRNRISLIEFMGKFKLNTYIYGPKDDPYHSSPNWRLPYPETEAKQLQELVQVSNHNKVDFVWAIHPGKDIKWTDEDRSTLLSKFESMYELGVRSYAVFFDDISGDGTNPERQADLLNYLNTEFIKKKQDVTPLVMCPTEYNKSWSNNKPGTYLDILGDKLDKSIEIMWTGDRVIGDITPEALDYINPRIKRSAYFWWNFPVSDYVRDHLLMGRSYGLDKSVKDKLSGVVSNPMERAEASKLAIYSIADYCWNLEHYDSNKSWEDAIKELLPIDAPFLRVFASHNSDLGANGHGYRREESVEITPTVEKFLKEFSELKYTEDDYKKINDEFKKIREASAKLLVNRENEDLITEIRPWLIQFDNLGQKGLKALEMVKTYEKDKNLLFWNKNCELKEINATMMRIDRSENQNPYQPGVKTGSLVMNPFADKVAAIIEKDFYNHLKGRNASRDTLSVALPNPKVTSNIRQLAKQALRSEENTISITPILEVVKIGKGQFIQLTLPMLTTLEKVEFDFGKSAIPDWMKIEQSMDGVNWEPMMLRIEGEKFLSNLKGMNGQMFRIKNTSDSEQEMMFKQFAVTTLQKLDTENNITAAMDKNFNSFYTLKGGEAITIDNTTMWNNFLYLLNAKETAYKMGSKMPEIEQITLLTSPNVNTNITLYVIDSKGKKVKAGTFTSSISSIPLVNFKNIVSVELKNNSGTAAQIYEMVWRDK